VDAVRCPDQRPAGRIPEHVRLALTGNPAGPDFVRASIAAAVADAIRPSLAPGSSIEITQTLPATEPLERGFITTFAVPVRIDPGPATAAVTGTTTVDVENLALADVAPQRLALGDDPERIAAAGVLSRTTVAVGRPTRIYYYHENMQQRRRFCIVLSANDSVRTHVQIVGAAAGPNIDVMSVGHAATKEFLLRQPRAEGTVLTIDGGRPVLGRDTLVGPGDGIVGVLDLRVLDGGPVTATVLAIPPDAQPATFLYGAKLPDDGHARHGNFALDDYGQRIIAYSAGGRDAAYVYGGRRPTLSNEDPADRGHDYGDYGVLERIMFDLANGGTEPMRVYLYEKPLGGDVRSSFVVNDHLTEMGCVRVARRYAVAQTEIAPDATGTFDVLTMTDGGSNYPLEIGVTTTPPLPVTPAISAADGCFPKPGGPPAAPQPAR
jgi:hypothetical protein